MGKRPSVEDMERLKIAITGASGFVGSNLVKYFLKNNTVFALTRNTKSWRLPSFNTVYFDIKNRRKVIDTIRKIRPDVLIHCAIYGAYHFENNVDDVIETNIVGTLNVLDACKNVSLFVNTGSSSEYGIRESVMNETNEVAPATNYAMSKALITNLLQSKNMNAVTMRLFSVYGYYEEKHRLIPYLLYCSIKGQTAKLSNKNNVRDFVFIDDVVKAYELAIQKHNKLDKGTIFNVGSGKQVAIKDVVNELDVDVEWDPAIREKEPDRVWQADISKIKKELGWKPEHALKEGLRKTKAWMKENIEFYEDERNDKCAGFKENSK